MMKFQVEIEKMRAETTKINKEISWYEVLLIVFVTLAVVAVTKIFL